MKWLDSSPAVKKGWPRARTKRGNWRKKRNDAGKKRKIDELKGKGKSSG